VISSRGHRVLEAWSKGDPAGLSGLADVVRRGPQRGLTRARTPAGSGATLYGSGPRLVLAASSDADFCELRGAFLTQRRPAAPLIRQPHP
jgi:hypothetical protein